MESGIELVIVYFAITLVDDKRLMLMTVVGRLTVVPYMCWVVGYVGGPSSALAGVLQDITFGGWTGWALSKKQLPFQRRNFDSIISRLTRTVLFVSDSQKFYRYAYHVRPRWHPRRYHKLQLDGICEG